MRRAHSRSLSFSDILVVLLCAVVLGVVAIGAFVWPHRRPKGDALIRDVHQLRAIHQSWLLFSQNFNGLYPTPSLVDRLPDPVLGDVPGRGPEDITKNTTANLYSLCIMQNLFPPDLCVSPSEPSRRVKVAALDEYNYEAYQPAAGEFWDENFKTDLYLVSNVSYAHMPLHRQLQLNRWRYTLDGNHPILGNRGPLGGVPDPNSITNRIHQPYDRWNGNIVNNDNSVSWTQEFPRAERPSNGGFIIAPECLKSGRATPPYDAMITFTKEMTQVGPVVQHD